MDGNDALTLMAAHGWLSRRPAEFRAEVVRRSRVRRFATGDSLYNYGDGRNGMFGLVSGRMLVRVPPADTIITVASPGQWLGEAAAFMGKLRWASVTAGSPLTVLHLPQSEFDAMAKDSANCRHFAVNTAETLAEAITVIGNLIQPDSEVRVAQRLLTFTGVHEVLQQRAFAFSQADLATMCGLSRQTISQVLTGLEARGIIALGYRRIEIIDLAALRALAIDDDRVWR